MISLCLTRWFMGYVRFSILGGSPERFLNFCARSGINLWDIRGGTNCSACVAAGKYRDLRPCARRAKSKIKVLERHGFSFTTKGIRKRRGLLVGTLLFIAVLYLLSARVWSIEVKGNTSIPTAQIQTELKELGIVPGIPKSKVQPQILQQKIMLKFTQIGWLSFNTHGCTAEVQLKEKTERPQVVQEARKIYNIKAAQTGQILNLDVYTGTAAVKQGDAVVKGQLLISGIIEDKEGRSVLRGATGKIIAATTHNLSTEVDLKRKVTGPTGKVLTRRSFSLFGVRIPLSLVEKPNGDYNTEGVHTDLMLMNSVLPISVYTEKWTELSTVDVVATKEQALDEAKKKVEIMIKEQLNDAKITSVVENSKIVESKLIYSAQIKCEENIAQESEIIIK